MAPRQPITFTPRRTAACVATAACLAGLAPARAAPPAYPDQARLCALNLEREAQRANAARRFDTPRVQQLLVNDRLAWTAGAGNAPPLLSPGDLVTLRGSGLGAGPDIDFSKVMIGNSRVLETDLHAFTQKLDLFSGANYETQVPRSTWPRDLLSWTDAEVRFRVPAHVSKGPLRLQVQKRLGSNPSLLRPGQPHLVIDAQRSRQPALSDPNCDVVSVLSADSKAIEPIEVQVRNGDFDALNLLGRQIFWSYDFNLGLSHKLRGLDWAQVLGQRATDPYTRRPADPRALFGAYPTVPGEVPAEAYADVAFSPYPQLNPTPGFLLVKPQRTAGLTTSTGWVGYRNAASSHPLLGSGAWAGFNCASCHGYRISYARGKQQVTKVFPGLPNPGWSMKWAVLGDKAGPSTANFTYIVHKEPGPPWAPGKAAVDKTALIYHLPAGTAEATVIRTAGEGSLYDNDHTFQPTAIPNVTFHLPIRRALSHTESYAGFEGSYIHSQEPDGAMGAMDARSIQALTAYMTTLDADDAELVSVGLHRWLRARGRLAQTGVQPASEGEFVQKGWRAYPGVVSAVSAGQRSFDAQCARCHADTLGAHTTEVMVPLTEVGRFFAPTAFQMQRQSIRASFLRNLYWVSSRGLLSDGHVRNLEDLVHPDRCAQDSPLYRQYYTVHAPVRPAPGTPDQPLTAPDLNRRGDVFRVPVSQAASLGAAVAAARNRFVERHRYFVRSPDNPDHYVWDFQALRRGFGSEMGASAPLGLPATPHPWCARTAAEVDDLVQYLLSL